MTQQQFEETLRQFLRREPFQAFVVELTNGETIHVPDRHVVFNGGVATYFSPEFDLIDFACDNVRAMRPAEEQVAT